MYRLFTTLLILTVALIVAPTYAENSSNDQAAKAKQRTTTKPAAGKTKKPTRRMPKGITAAREAAAVAFVTEHHAELSELLTSLKTNQPKEYFKAVRDLFRVSERLAQIQEANTERYELELRAWKLKSQIDLLVARLKMAPRDKGLQAELKQALVGRVEARKQILLLERRRIAARLATLDAQINKLKKSHEQLSRQQLHHLLKTTHPTSTSAKKKPRTPQK